jgi:hypothetical protein
VRACAVDGESALTASNIAAADDAQWSTLRDGLTTLDNALGAIAYSSKVLPAGRQNSSEINAACERAGLKP